MNSYLTFSEALSKSNLLKDRSDLFVVNLYREAIRLGSVASNSFRELSSSRAVNALVKAFRHAGLCGWSIRDLEMPECRSKELDVSALVLRFAWLQYAEPIAHVTRRVSEFDSEEMQAVVSVLTENSNTLKTKIVPNLLTKISSQESTIQKGWKMFQTMMEHARYGLFATKLCEYVPCTHAFELAGGYDAFFNACSSSSSSNE